MEELIQYCKYSQNVSLRDKTWIHRGGHVDYWFKPSCYEELVTIGKLLMRKKEPFIVIGHTSNIYFKNTYNIKYVVDTRGVKDFEFVDKSTLRCDCGVPMAKISKLCVEKGIAGYEGMVDLPGTVGGGIFGNSGCYGCGIETILKSVELLNEKGEIKFLSSKELEFSFRSSSLKRGEISGIILRAYFETSKHQDSSVLKKIAENNHKNRVRTQDPPSKNLGTTVNVYGYKKNIRNLIVRIVTFFLKICGIQQQNRNYIGYLLLCLMYNSAGVAKYISKKRINCFLWKDDRADIAFPKYLKMCERVYDVCKLEIDIKE